MIVLDRSAVIRSFGLLTGGLPLDSAFWRFLTAMMFMSTPVTCLDGVGQKDAGVQSMLDARCTQRHLSRLRSAHDPSRILTHQLFDFSFALCH